MFFIGIFGVENKEKFIKKIFNLSCKNCTNTKGFTLIKNYKYFHFFFIPLFKWEKTYYLTCDDCNTIYEIPFEKGEKIENGEDIDINYWDLKILYENYNKQHVCPNCGKPLDSSFDFCPYCGKSQH
ncbi:hypothetical protein CLOACE_05920 [Clostridium acetireducens DSM 10703]|jgi:hypothetical protein|uniref:Zinc-ribbon 15 domain-containing protein n=1 Tax=Clostridium acetireducens DSM 10703 TaxID=1121290 RepID=A0A1E8F0Q0_9CLOT|nr:zinc ribbon domain-containing protein [Clostridium acetireducens]OFI07006.1 hypothetical protein CLOACE_05920 [Clostridium acetireducens DSM 10703]